MRILMIDSAPHNVFGGVERWLVESARGLIGRGHRVHVAGRPGSRFLARIIEEGIPATGLPFGVRYDPVTAYRLARLARREEAEIAFVNYNRELSQLALARRWCGIRAVVGRGILPLMETERKDRRLYAKTLDGLVTPTRASLEELERLPWLRTTSVVRLPGAAGPDLVEAARSLHGDRDRVREELSLSPDAFVIGAVGRFEAHKGYGHLLEAFHAVCERVPEAILILVGDGPEDAALRDRASQDLEVASRVLFTGFRPDVHRFLLAMDVLVMPSTSRHETFGHAALDAMAFGLPIVVSSIGGLPELVEDGGGLLVPPGDEARLAEVLCELASDPALRERLGGEGRRAVAENYGRERLLDGLETYLQRLLS